MGTGHSSINLTGAGTERREVKRMAGLPDLINTDPRFFKRMFKDSSRIFGIEI